MTKSLRLHLLPDAMALINNGAFDFTFTPRLQQLTLASQAYAYRRPHARRQQKGGKALSVITVDSPVESGVLEQVRVAIEAEQMTAININFS